MNRVFSSYGKECGGDYLHIYSTEAKKDGAITPLHHTRSLNPKVTLFSLSNVQDRRANRYCWTKLSNFLRWICRRNITGADAKTVILKLNLKDMSVCTFRDSRVSSAVRGCNIELWNTEKSELLGFWTLSIVRNSKTLENTTFQKLKVSVLIWGERDTYCTASLRQRKPQSVDSVLRPSPEDGNRSSVRNVVFQFFRIPDDGQSQNPSNSEYYTPSAGRSYASRCPLICKTKT
jgi:hypothetical protein